MASEIRANTIKNRVGLGTVSYTDTGIIVSGIVTANSFKGDGSSLTGIDATSLKDSAGNVKIQAQASGAVFTGIHTFTTLHSTTATIGDYLDVGSNIKIGNAGVITATTFVGNVTGNVTGNISGGTVAGSTGAFSGDVSITDKIVHTDDTNTAIRFPEVDAVTIETNGSERFRINSSGAWGIGAAYGSSGQVLTSGGSGSSPSWTTVSGTTINNNANDRVITGSGTANTLEGEANLTFETATTGGTLTVAGTSEYQIKLKDSNSSGNGAETALAFTDSGDTIQGFVGFNYWGDGNLDIQNSNTGGSVCINTGGGNERLVVTSDGDIYGPSGGRKNWFDNGSFDCIGGRRANTSMDYGNHHAYGWVTDRFQSRNSVQWTRSTNVPTGKGFSYSTQTSGAGGRLVQAVELPDYGDMGVFAPSSYWCVSVWSTAGVNQSGQAFSYDLGSTKTDIPIVTPSSGGVYLSSGETASGTSTGTFTRYYAVFQMPSSIISTATSAYFTWAFQAAGYATGFQLERVPTSTSKPTPYEHVHPSVTINRCRRYCYQVVNSRLMNGYKRHDGNIFWAVQFPVPPTHMPSGSNQSVPPYGIHLHDAGHLSNFQSVLQNPGVNSLSISEFDYRSGRFLINGTTSYSSTHTTVPAWESQEYEIQHGHF